MYLYIKGDYNATKAKIERDILNKKYYHLKGKTKKRAVDANRGKAGIYKYVCLGRLDDPNVKAFIMNYYSPNGRSEWNKILNNAAKK